MDAAAGGAYHPPMAREQQDGRGVLAPRSVTWLGMGVNAALGVGKVLVGVVFRSQAILADGFHSASDMVTDAAVLAGLRVSKKPADEDHHYGHRRASTLAALFVGLALVGAAAWIAYKALLGLHGPSEAVRGPLPFVMALVSIPAKEVLYRLTRRVGRRFGDVSLTANAWHHRSDAFTSLAAAVGLGGVLIGGAEWQFLDHVTALLLAVFLVVAAARVVRESAEEMMDRAPGRTLLDRIERVVGETDGVVSFHAFRARRVGGRVEMDIHVQVDPKLTVRQGHAIATDVKRRVLKADPSVVEAIVHVEPAGDETAPAAEG
jgi:cation diffusion facilitator family transporter